MKKIYLLGAALVASAMSLTTQAAFPSEQVWEATRTNSQQVCGIDYTNSSKVGQILVKGEAGTDGEGAIEFDLKSNTRQMAWKVTEAKLVENAGRFNFNDDLLTVNDRNQTSLYVNNTEYDWSQVSQDHPVDPKAKIRLAPKINLDATEFPTGTTKIQGKIVVTCSN